MFGRPSRISIDMSDLQSRLRELPQVSALFEDERLAPLLENIHESVHHAGKFPKRAPDASLKQYELIKMRNDLRIAIEKEDYEQAARLRDQIRRVEE